MPQAAQMSPVPETQGQSSSVEQASRLGLEQAFALFNQMSSQLTDSYSMLEARVTELKGELAVVSAQRMQELAEKERLANRLQNLLDLLPGGVIVIDAQGIVREANPAACDLLGLTVVKAVARAHQGELLLRSRPGRGTCALVVLPLFCGAQGVE